MKFSCIQNFPDELETQVKLRHIIIRDANEARIDFGKLIKGASNLECVAIHWMHSKSIKSLLNLTPSDMREHENLVFHCTVTEKLSEDKSNALTALGYTVTNHTLIQKGNLKFKSPLWQDLSKIVGHRFRFVLERFFF